MTAGLAVSAPHLDEQTSAAPGISPGIVRDNEIVLRELLSPDHIEKGLITPAAVELKELQQTGASVHRAKHAVAEEVRASVARRLEARRSQDPNRPCEARISAPTAGQIRGIRIEKTGEQIFVVIDTAEFGNPSHASIYRRNPEMQKSRLRKLRTDLLLPVLQENLMPVEEALEKVAG